MSVLDYFLFIAIFSIWAILIINVILTISGYVYYLRWTRRPAPELPDDVPFVTIMVPAHNEGIVIVKTVLALLAFDYPPDRDHCDQ